MIKKIQQFFANRFISKEHRKLEAEFLKMQEETLAFEEKCRLQLEDFERQAAELPEGPEKERTEMLLNTVRYQHESIIAQHKMRFAQTRMHLDILRLSIV